MLPWCLSTRLTMLAKSSLMKANQYRRHATLILLLLFPSWLSGKSSFDLCVVKHKYETMLLRMLMSSRAALMTYGCAMAVSLNLGSLEQRVFRRQNILHRENQNNAVLEIESILFYCQLSGYEFLVVGVHYFCFLSVLPWRTEKLNW